MSEDVLISLNNLLVFQLAQYSVWKNNCDMLNDFLRHNKHYDMAFALRVCVDMRLPSGAV